ncbi:MAG TPA: cupredoxin family copper-binding protein [Solirubrobacterales bacterium]|jgi:plastocyanin
MNNLRRTAALSMILPALTLAACGDSDSDTTSESPAPSAESAETESPAGENAPAPSGEAVRSEKVTISDFEYDPETVTVQAGGKVIWQNEDSAEHTATLDDGSFTTGALAEGKLKSESFKTPGTYTYFCEIHPQMKGTVEVVEAG